MAEAVNSYCAAAGLGFQRTTDQCKGRVKTLCGVYEKELSGSSPSRWRWFGDLDAVLATPPRGKHVRPLSDIYKNPTATGGAAGGRAPREADVTFSEGRGAAAAAGEGGDDPGGVASENTVPAPTAATHKQRMDARVAAESLLGLSGAAGVAAPRREGSSSSLTSAAAAVVIKGFDVILKSIEVDRERDTGHAHAHARRDGIRNVVNGDLH